MIKRNYEMEVLINNRTVKEYFHNYKTYIEGRKSSIFSIRLKNNSSERTLFVLTVDGLSVIDGKDGSFDSRGYILDAYSSMKIDGWRLNDNEIAEFYFSTVDDSYRKRKDKGNNVGSVAVAIFREKEKQHFCPDVFIPYEKIEPKPWVPRYPWEPTRPNNPIDDIIYTPRAHCKNDIESANKLGTSGTININNCTSHYLNSNAESTTVKNYSQDIGTGFGQTKRSEVISVSFDKESKPDAVLEIFYNSRKQLSKIGVDFDRRRYSISEPNSFPDEDSYCKRPRD